MGKVPVGRSISEAYKFLVLRLGAWVGLGWLPAAFYGAAVWFCLRWLGSAMQTVVPSSSMFNEFTAIVYVALLLATALLVPTAAVPFASKALGEPRDPVAAHFVYGGREFRLSLALLGFYVVLIAVVAALAVAAQFAIGVGLPRLGQTGFSVPTEWLGVPFALWLNAGVAVLLGIAALFVMVRFGFYLPSIAAAEQHVSLGRAWSLSSGSFWRIAVVQFVIAVPVTLAMAGGIWLIEGNAMQDAVRTAWTGVPSEGISAVFRLQSDHATTLAALWAVGMVVTSGLFSAASATAYRAAVLGEEVEAREPVYESEPSFVPAWDGAPAMADAGPRWQGEPVLQAQEPVPQLHAEPAAEPVVEATPAELAAEPEHAGEPIILAEQIHGWHPDAQSYASEAAAMTVVEPVAEPEVVHAEAAPVEITPPAEADAPPASEALTATAPEAAEHGAALQDFIPVETATAEHPVETLPPLDPAGAHAVIAAREEVAQAAE